MDDVEKIIEARMQKVKNNILKKEIENNISNVKENASMASDAINSIIEEELPSQSEQIEFLLMMVDTIISDIIPSVVDDEYNEY